MRPETILDDWLKTLVLDDGKPPQLNDSGVAFVTVADAYSIGVTVNPESRNVGFICFLIPAPEVSEGEFLYQVLSYNLALLATRNASLGIDVESGMVVLGRTVLLDSLDVEKFKEFFVVTADMATKLRETLLEQMKSAKPTGTADVPAFEEGQGNWLKL